MVKILRSLYMFAFVTMLNRLIPEFRKICQKINMKILCAPEFKCKDTAHAEQVLDGYLGTN